MQMSNHLAQYPVFSKYLLLATDKESMERKNWCGYT